MSDASAAVPLRRAPVSLRSLLQSTVGVMNRQAQAIDATLTLAVDADVPETLYIDPEKIAWAITALVGNALRFVRRGTRLRRGGTIQVCARHDAARSATVLEVEDDGAGIAPETLAELLRRPPDRIHASGLALSLIQDIVAAHGGSVEVESSTETDRSGTTVRLIIPGR
jgi:signal transduction histidine kinase